MKDTQIAELLAYLKQAVEFGKEQVPLLAEEMLRYGWMQGWLFFTLAVLLLGAALAGLIMIVRGEEEWVTGTGVAALILGVIVGLPMFMFTVSDLIKIHYAPRLYLLERLASMIGS